MHRGKSANFGSSKLERSCYNAQNNLKIIFFLSIVGINVTFKNNSGQLENGYFTSKKSKKMHHVVGYL